MFEIDLYRLCLLGLFRFLRLVCVLGFLGRIGLVFIFISGAIAGVLLILDVLTFVLVFIFVLRVLILILRLFFSCFWGLLIFTLGGNGRCRFCRQSEPVYAARNLKFVA